MEEVDIALVLRHAAAADDGGARIAAEVARLAALAAEHHVALIAWEPLANHYDAEAYFRAHFAPRAKFTTPVQRVEASSGLAHSPTTGRTRVLSGKFAVGAAHDCGGYSRPGILRPP